MKVQTDTLKKPFQIFFQKVFHQQNTRQNMNIWDNYKWFGKLLIVIVRLQANANIIKPNEAQGTGNSYECHVYTLPQL